MPTNKLAQWVALLKADGKPGHRLFAFSNGTAEKYNRVVLRASGLRERFEGVVSCDALETFKPNPDVYRYFMNEAGGSNDAWLISGNPFDVILEQ